MKKIFKFKLEVTEMQTFPMPKDAVILSVQVQNHNIYLWAIFDDSKIGHDNRTFHIIGTGNPIHPSIPDACLFGGGYIGTVQQSIFVWHIFEEKI